MITYPELSADWLLLEKGEMLRKNAPKAQQQEEKVQSIAVSATDPSSNACNVNLTLNVPQEIIMLLTSQQQTIQDLTSTIKILTTK